MTPQRMLRLSVLLCCVLGTFLLGIGEHDLTLTILMLAAAPTSLLFTDQLGWLRLNRPLANIGALSAVSYALFDFFNHGIQNQLLAIANLLLYLQLILLFQEKNLRIYWQLLVLSLLQVVVSAAMNLNVAFGAILAIYVACALVTLAMLFVVSETQRYSPDRGELGGAEATFSNVELARRILLPSGSWATTNNSSVALVAQPVLEPSVAQRQLLSSDFLRLVYAVCGLSLFFTAALFFSAPRLQGSSWQGSGGGRQSRVGFSTHVSLEEFGDILESDELAMRVAFFDEATGEPYSVVEPYFRGAVLTNYGDLQMVGRWSNPSRSEPRPLAPPPASAGPLVRQEIMLESSAETVLFGVYPSYRMPTTPGEVYADRSTGQLVRQATVPWQLLDRFHYQIGTPAFKNGVQQVVTPFEPVPVPRRNQDVEREVVGLRAFDPRKFPRLDALADQVLTGLDLAEPGSNRVLQARALEQHFHISNYTYSLRIPRRRSPGIDPLEEFVSQSRTGHCQFFASALVMMLRSRNIPARLVVGFRGGEMNSVGGYYLVRQRDAHAWVEAYLRRQDLAEFNLQDDPLYANGGWLRLDPTPPSDSSGAAQSGSVGRIGQLLDYAEFLWSDYIVELNYERQRRNVYRPFVARMNNELANWLDIGRWRTWWRTALQSTQWEKARRWGAFGLGVVLSLSLLLWCGMRWRSYMPRGVRRILEWLARRWTSSTHSKRIVVEFYARCERLLERRGWRRPVGRTPREFLADLPPTIAQRVQPIVDAYYRVRFGGATLDNHEGAAIEQALLAIEQLPL